MDIVLKTDDAEVTATVAGPEHITEAAMECQRHFGRDVTAYIKTPDGLEPFVRVSVEYLEA